MNTVPTKGWRRDEYRQRTGERRITHIEITPESDARSHKSSEDCDCIPVLENENGVAILIHNAFDGREMNERGNAERGQ